VKYHNPDSAIFGINDSLEDYQKKWQAIIFEYQDITGSNHEPKRITWYRGEGWDIIGTVHYEPVPSSNPMAGIKFVSNVYSFYVSVEDDLLGMLKSRVLLIILVTMVVRDLPLSFSCMTNYLVTSTGC
jgi:hypothetical protein